MLFKKMLRDMKNNKTQFLSIFLMAFLGVFIYAGVGGEWLGLQRTADKYYKDTNFADMWVYGENLTETELDKAKEIEGVTDAQLRLYMPVSADLEKKPDVSLFFMEDFELSKFYLVSGEEFDKEKEGLWLDDRFAEAHDLSVGDKLTLLYEGLDFEKEILGTIHSPEYVYMTEGSGMVADFTANGFAYLSKEAFPVPEAFQYNQLLLTVEDGEESAVENRIQEVLKDVYSVIQTRVTHESFIMFDNEIDQHKSIGYVFPIVFLVVALLTMMTTMTRLVNNQRVQIGTLKALGFQKGTILRHYISYGFWLALVGSLLGAITGPLVLPPLFYPSMSSFYTMPEWKTAYDISFYLVAILTTAACTLVTFAACRRLLKDTPSKTLRPKAPKSAKHGILDRFAFWKRLSFQVQWNYRDIMRNKMRSFMAVFGVLGCTALLVCAFGMNDSMKDLKKWQYEDINQYTSLLTLDAGVTEYRIQELKKEYNAEALMEDAVEIKSGNVKKAGLVTIQNDVTLIQYTDAKKNPIELPEDGLALSYKLAKQLGVTVGDTISWHLYGDSTWITQKVAIIYRTPTAQGIVLSKDVFEDLDHEFIPTSLVTKALVEEELDGVTSIQTADDLTSGWDDFTESMMLMVVILIAAASVLAVVVLYNLGVLSFMEMERELATLKVVGFQSNMLQQLLLKQNLGLSFVGFLLGIPCGKFLIDMIMALTGDTFDMVGEIHLTNIGLSLAIALVLCILVNFMFRRKIVRLHMVEALKGVE